MYQLPVIIQGGMGVYVSTPFLAQAAAKQSVLGTVSGVVADKILARVLQNGDPGGHYRRALAHFPFPNVAQQVLATYFVPGGIPTGQPYKLVPAVTLEPTQETIALLICANFAFVWLAKEGHDHPISINWLEKIQMPHLYSIYGAMLAGIDVVTLGAGIPLQIPGLLDAYANGQPAEYRVNITGSGQSWITMRFDPEHFFGQPMPTLRRPAFLPIVSSHVLAAWMIKKAPGGIQGFVIEGPTAGGHNAPPREHLGLNELGEPKYGEGDKPNLEKLRGMKLPFWLGGGLASPEGLASALAVGAHGIQAGSIFALCNESGLDPNYRRQCISLWHRQQLRIKQDPHASPTGFPFQVAQLPGTLSDEAVFLGRHRSCNQQALVVPHRMTDGQLVYRCPAELERIYLQKEGHLEATLGVRCICNGLISATGFGDPDEPAIITMGADLSFLQHLINHEDDSYTLSQAIDYLNNPA